MPKKGYISEFVNGGRIVSHGKIESLENGFKICDGVPFSIYVRPKNATSSIDVLINLKCYQDEEASNVPVPLNDWSPLLVSEIAPDATLLNYYDIYWGSGCHIESV